RAGFITIHWIYYFSIVTLQNYQRLSIATGSYVCTIPVFIAVIRFTLRLTKTTAPWAPEAHFSTPVLG
ncbi:MAG: hypothetical protein WBU20_27715, partial [Candidatus Acidiferrum sp.]